MRPPDRTEKIALLGFLALLGGGAILPQWALFLVTLALAKGLVVLSLLLLMRTGLVSFGHGLYYCLGAYAAGTVGQFLHIGDVAVMLLVALAVSCAVALIVGLLLASYRGIFFAMLSLAFSMILYGLLVGRGLMIAASAPTVFARLMAGSIALMFFTYAFVNMGMVSGILPVVGVPLPFLSYGGSALLTLFIGTGILMSVNRHRKLVQT